MLVPDGWTQTAHFPLSRMRTAALAVALLAVACQQARADVTSLTLQVRPLRVHLVVPAALHDAPC